MKSKIKEGLMNINPILDPHEHIAFDLDECLLDGSLSVTLRNYIENNPSKLFSIISNRPGHMLETSIIEIDNFLGFSADLTHQIFQYIILSPNGSIPGDKVVENFKGMFAEDIGATILVDDDLSHKPGCDAHNVSFLHIPFTPVSESCF